MSVTRVLGPLCLNGSKWVHVIWDRSRTWRPYLTGDGATPIGNGIYDNIQNKNKKNLTLHLIDDIFTCSTIMSNNDLYVSTSNDDSMARPNIVWWHKDGDLWCKLPLHLQSQMSPMGRASFDLLVCEVGWCWLFQILIILLSALPYWVSLRVGPRTSGSQSGTRSKSFGFSVQEGWHGGYMWGWHDQVQFSYIEY